MESMKQPTHADGFGLTKLTWRAGLNSFPYPHAPLVCSPLWKRIGLPLAYHALHSVAICCQIIVAHRLVSAFLGSLEKLSPRAKENRPD